MTRALALLCALLSRAAPATASQQHKEATRDAHDARAARSSSREPADAKEEGEEASHALKSLSHASPSLLLGLLCALTGEQLPRTLLEDTRTVASATTRSSPSTSSSYSKPASVVKALKEKRDRRAAEDLLVRLGQRVEVRASILLEENVERLVARDKRTIKRVVLAIALAAEQHESQGATHHDQARTERSDNDEASSCSTSSDQLTARAPPSVTGSSSHSECECSARDSGRRGETATTQASRTARTSSSLSSLLLRGDYAQPSRPRRSASTAPTLVSPPPWARPRSVGATSVTSSPGKRKSTLELMKQNGLLSPPLPESPPRASASGSRPQAPASPASSPRPSPPRAAETGTGRARKEKERKSVERKDRGNGSTAQSRKPPSTEVPADRTLDWVTSTALPLAEEQRRSTSVECVCGARTPREMSSADEEYGSSSTADSAASSSSASPPRRVQRVNQQPVRVVYEGLINDQGVSSDIARFEREREAQQSARRPTRSSRHSVPATRVEPAESTGETTEYTFDDMLGPRAVFAPVNTRNKDRRRKSGEAPSVSLSHKVWPSSYNGTSPTKEDVLNEGGGYETDLSSAAELPLFRRVI